MIMSDILQESVKFRYNSFLYTKPDDIVDFIPLRFDDNSIIIYEKNANIINIGWAVNKKETLLDGIKKLIEIFINDQNDLKIGIEFVPETFVNDLQKLGFYISCEWVDFWLDDLSNLPEGITCVNSIRDIKSDEIEEASKVTRLCAGFSRGYKGETSEWLLNWIKQENSKVFVSLCDDIITGVCCVSLYGFDRKEGIILWLREIAVHPDYHSKKIGLNLMIYALLWGRKNGAVTSFLACDKENKKAIALYEGLGYRRKDNLSQINMELIIQKYR